MDHHTASDPGPREMNGASMTDIWHTHVVPVTDPYYNYFSPADMHAAASIGGNNYMEDVTGAIWVHGPAQLLIPQQGTQIRPGFK